MRTVDMGDAALGLACSEIDHPPNWAVVRNMSDPVINGDLSAKEFHPSSRRLELSATTPHTGNGPAHSGPSPPGASRRPATGLALPPRFLPLRSTSSVYRVLELRPCIRGFACGWSELFDDSGVDPSARRPRYRCSFARPDSLSGRTRSGTARQVADCEPTVRWRGSAPLTCRRFQLRRRKRLNRLPLRVACNGPCGPTKTTSARSCSAKKAPSIG
jgi:hypothetical protein